MANDQTFLQAMYDEQCEQARMHEQMRQQGTSLMLTLSGSLAALTAAGLGTTAGLVAHTKIGWAIALYALPGFIAVRLSALGKRLSLKHYERNRLHIERARQYRSRLERLFPGSDYRDVRKQADSEHEKGWIRDGLNPKIIEERLHLGWKAIYSFVNYLGLFLIIASLIMAILLECFYGVH